MEFTCPHCGKTFETKLREASRSEKANEARRRNGTLGGHAKASEADLLAVYSQRDNWTWQDFVSAVKKKTGVTYSRVRAFALLRKFKTTRDTSPVSGYSTLQKAPTGKKAAPR